MFQFAWSILAGLLLFVIVRQTIAQDRVAGTIVAVGLLLRAIVGQAIFWISYLQLPIAPHMQTGNGLWFFALDGQVYLANAIELSEHGAFAIASAPRSGASVSYVQALSTFVLFLGQSAAVGLLLNLFLYVLTCSVILWWARHSAAMRRPALFALLALAASPAGVLWSMQPLKDTFFQFLVVAFLGGAFAWNTAWAGRRLRSGVLVSSLLVMSAALFAIAGVRWYYAFAMLLATSVFFLHVSLLLAPRPLIAVAISAFALFLLSQAFLGGAGPYVPNEVRTALVPRPSWVANTAQTWREGFVRTGGATSIVSNPIGKTPVGNLSTPAGKLSTPVGKLSAPASTRPTLNAWLVGLAATFVPSSLHPTIGLPAISGGQGMLHLTDIDTIFFDIIMVVGLTWSLVFAKRAWWWSNSMLMLVGLLTVVMGAPLVYVVTNFGTLFRLRGMLLVTAAILPLAAASLLRRHSLAEQGRVSLRLGGQWSKLRPNGQSESDGNIAR